MAIIIQTYEKAGTMAGMPVIRETGLCEESTDLTTYETGRVEISPLPRAVGLVAKALDGQTITLATITADMVVGTLANLLQLGLTQIRRAFPEQPFGTYNGKEIMAYERTFVQLEAA